MPTPDTVPVSTQLKGGAEIRVTFNDDRPAEAIVVPLVPIRKAMDYLNVVGSLPEFLAFITGKPDDWVDALTDESTYAIDSKAKELNDPRIDRFMTRQAETVEKLVPLATRSLALQKSVPTA